jgi:hypothetical protein
MLETPDVVSYNLGRGRGHESLTHRSHGGRTIAEREKLETPDVVSYKSGRGRGYESLILRAHGERAVAEQEKLETSDVVSYKSGRGTRLRVSDYSAHGPASHLFAAFVSQDLAGTRASVLVLVHHFHAVDEDGLETGGVVVRIVEGGVVLHGDGIKHHEVGPIAGSELAAALQVEGIGG